MTVKLYDTDSYRRECTAVVLACEPVKGGYQIELDQTVFFPEGGGQPADKGTINGIEVLDVQIDKADRILHKTASPLEPGFPVQAVIDWETRFSRMQNHSGEHVLSGTIHSEYGYSNVGFHMGETFLSVDVDGKLSEQDMEKIEQLVNAVVYDNRSITVTFPSAEELQTLDYRSKLDLTENVRIVTIDGCDCCACCAPHVARTGEIGLIKILNFYPHRGGTRIELLCGQPAFADYQQEHAATKEIMRLLSSKKEEVADALKRSMDTMLAIKSENKALKEQLALSRLETTEQNGSIFGFSPQVSYDELRYCANTLQTTCSRFCLLFSETSENECLYVVSSQTENTKPLVSALNTALNGRGGGKEHYAQGKVSASKADIIQYLQTTL